METPKNPSTLDAKAVESLPEKPLTNKDADSIKGGAMGPGTQTEDDIYVGVKKR
jgi:hypothetical protein